MIEIEIDGKKLQANEGAMVIQVADAAGIYIPRFCYHRKLTIAANCRMCLVEVEKSPKTLPACATPITPNMKVFTQSEKALASQRAVMEFLLINHPLDCPICDQGGECELQDLAMGYGRDISRFQEGKRSVKDKNLGALVASDMTRCIQCTRCVRFSAEVAGMPELGATGRGDRLEIGTYVQHTLQSEVSGNIIDLCPVGALTSKPFRFKGRAWEMTQHPAIAVHDCIGSNIFIHTRSQEYNPRRQIMRVVPRDNEAINETWLSDRDRYSYEALNSPMRLSLPLMKRGDTWEEVDWETALSAAMERIKSILQEHGASQLGALISPSSTVEELFLFQKFIRALGSDNIDHRYRQNDFRDQQHAPLYPTLGIPIAELENQKAILLIGSDIRREQPVANIRLRKVSLKKNPVMCVNPVDYDFNFVLSEKLIDPDIVGSLVKIVKALSDVSKQELPNTLQTWVSSVRSGALEKKIAKVLLHQESAAILLGAYALNHPQASRIRLLAKTIAQFCKASYGELTEGANSAGAWLAGAVPHRHPAGVLTANSGLDAKSMFEQKLRGYLLFNMEPEVDCAYPALALQALRQAETVIAFTPFYNDRIKEYAHIILPIAAFAETSGTYINAQTDWQTMEAVSLPYGEVRPAWKVLRVLGNLLNLPNFNYVRREEILQELKTLTETVHAESVHEELDLTDIETFPKDTLQRVTHWPMYRVDTVVRYSQCLQDAIDKDVAAIRIHPSLAEVLNLKAGDWVNATQNGSKVTLPLVLDERIAGNQISIPAGLEATAGFGEAFGSVELYK